MELYLQSIVNGLISGSIYAFVAIGFSLVYNVGKFVHFAHGAMVMVGAYIFYSLINMGVPVTLAFLAPIPTAFIGLLLFELVYHPLIRKGASKVIFIVAGLALLIIIQYTLQLIYTSAAKVTDVFAVNRGIEIFHQVFITGIQITIIGVSLILFLVFYVFLKKTSLGQMMRAVADNDELAQIVGIKVGFLKQAAFFLASLTAGIGGVFIAVQESITPGRGVYLIIKGFAGAVMGGIQSIPASILGAYFLGLVENVSIIYVPSAYKLSISFSILFVFLIFFPGGLVYIYRKFVLGLPDS